jgi:hypothetical protein
MGTIHAEHGSPEALYADIKDTATSTVNNVKTFTDLVRDPRTQRILARANESRKDDSNGIQEWLVTQHPDWLIVPPETLAPALGIGSEDAAENDGIGIKEEDLATDLAAIVDSFRKEHAAIEVTVEPNGQDIRVRCRSDPFSFNNPVLALHCSAR